MGKTRGITLMEILAVLAIIALLIALLLPVIRIALERARLSQCITNLHQIGQAIQMYLQDYESYPGRLGDVHKYVKSPNIYICPSDPAIGRPTMGSAVEGVYTRYWTVLAYLSSLSRGNSPDHAALRILREHDSNHGILICSMHGNRDTTFYSDPDPVLVTDGKMLRLRLDSSVQQIHIRFSCQQTSPGVIEGYLPIWHLLTDVRPCPESVPEESGFCPVRRNAVECP